MKILIAMAFVLTVSSVQAQDTKIERKAEFYAEEAAKEFGLSKEQKEELVIIKAEQMRTGDDLAKRRKAGEFGSDEEFKKKKKAALKPYQSKINKMFGGDKEAIKAFHKNVGPKIKKIK